MIKITRYYYCRKHNKNGNNRLNHHINRIHFPQLQFLLSILIILNIWDVISNLNIPGLTIGSTLIPIQDKIEELTGSFLLGLLVYTLLGFIDLVLAYGIIYIIDTTSNNRGVSSSISGMRNSVNSLMNAVTG